MNANYYGFRRQQWVLTLLDLCLSIVAGAIIGAQPRNWVLIILGLVAIGVAFHLTTVPPQKARVKLLGGTLFWLTAFPVARVVLPGNMPIYFTDILTFIILISILFYRKFDPDWSSAQPLPTLLLIFWLPTTFFAFVHEIQLTGNYYETIYMFFRTILSLSMFFVIPVSVRDKQDLYWIIICVSLGITITASLSILNSVLPPLHPINRLIDSLSPAALEEKGLSYLSHGDPVRARALIGSPIATGNIILLFLPLSYGLYISGKFQSREFWLWLMMMIGVFGIITTYSRSPIVGLCLTIASLLITRPTRSFTLGLTLFVCVGIFFIGEAKGLLQIEFVWRKLAQAISDPSVSYNDRARILAYQQVPGFLLRHPSWLLVGRGFATLDLAFRGLLPSYIEAGAFNTQNHSLLVITFYQRGLVATFILILIFFNAFGLLVRHQFTPKIKSNEANEFGWLDKALLASLIGIMQSALWGHSFATVMPAQTAMFIFFGLVIVAQRFSTAGQHIPVTEARL